jgi:uncharacterized protein involved in response to NO
MTHGFIGAFAVGFLGTMLPRRAGAEPLTALELAALAALLVGSTAAAWLDQHGVARLLFGGALLVLLRWVAFTALRRRAVLDMPPSFVLLPVALALGIASAFVPARAPVAQGMLLALVLALVPMLGPILATGRPATASGPRWPYLCAGVALLAACALSPRAATGLRGLIALAIIAVSVRPFERPGAHRRLFALALWAIPAGLIVAAVAPGARVSALHLTYLGGLALLTFAISTHVTLLHTGRDELALRSPWPVLAGGALIAAAAVARLAMMRATNHWFTLLFAAAALWLAATALWLAWLAPKLWRPR